MAYGSGKLSVISKTILCKDVDNGAATTEGKPLYQMRNEKLIARYYYYTVVKKKMSNNTLMLLSDEFCISTKRISDVLEENIEAIKNLRKQNPKLSWFKKHWPSITW